jgi:hypothetical protein
VGLATAVCGEMRASQNNVTSHVDWKVRSGFAAEKTSVEWTLWTEYGTRTGSFGQADMFEDLTSVECSGGAGTVRRLKRKKALKDRR